MITEDLRRFVYGVQKGLKINPFYKYLKDNILFKNRALWLLLFVCLLLNFFLFLIWRYSIDTGAGIRFIEEQPIVQNAFFLPADFVLPFVSLYFLGINIVLSVVLYRLTQMKIFIYTLLSVSIVVSSVLIIASLLSI